MLRELITCPLGSFDVLEANIFVLSIFFLESLQLEDILRQGCQHGWNIIINKRLNFSIETLIYKRIVTQNC